MRPVAVLIVVLLAIFVCAGASRLYATDEDVMILHDGNFERVASTKAVMIVFFYAPWCSQCDRWAPVFASLATEMKNSGAFFAKIDATSVQTPQNWNTSYEFVRGVETARKFQVSSFPTMKLLHYGKVNTELKVTQDKDVVRDIVALFTRPSSLPLASIDDVKRCVTSNPNSAVAIGFFDDQIAVNQFAHTGDSFRGTVLFFHVEVGDRHESKEAREMRRYVFTHFGVNGTIVLFHPDDGSPSSWLATGFGQRQRGNAFTDDTQRRALSGMGRNFVVLSDFVVLRSTKLGAESATCECARYGSLCEKNNFGASEFSHDAMVAFITSHALNPVGVLSSKNRHLYRARTNSTLFFFVVLPRSNPLPSAQSSAESASEGSGECGHDGSSGDECGSKGKVKSTSSPVAISEPELRYFGNRLARLAQHPQFRNFTFLFVDAEENAQIFESFGYDGKELYSAAGRHSVSQRHYLIGVIDVDRKYRYPFDEFAVELVEKFLLDIIARRVSPFVKSSRAPPSVPKPGEGKVALLVFDNFEQLVKRDAETDAIVLFANPHEEYSAGAAQSLKLFAESQKGNAQLFIGVYNALYNDPPKGFEVPHLPYLFFVPRSEKKKIEFSTDTPLTSVGRTKRRLKKNPDGSVTEEAFESDLYERLNGFRPIGYTGDFSVQSIQSFANDQIERSSRKKKV